MAKLTLYSVMRKLHRDFGYLAIGLTLIYALSGILLMFRGSDFMMKEVAYEKNLSKEMNVEQLEGELAYRRFKVKKETGDKIIFNVGAYDKRSGVATYTLREYVAPFNMFVSLHKIGSSSPALWFMVGYGSILAFLAISALFMYAPRHHHFKRGMVLTLIGVVVAIIFCFVVG